MEYLTSFVGNPNALPTIKAAAGFKGNWMIDSGELNGLQPRELLD